MTDEDYSEGLYRYKDLEAKGIVNGRVDLARKLKKHGFPKPIKVGDRQVAYLKAEVHAWLRKQAEQRDEGRAA